MAVASLGRLTLDLLVRLGSFEQGMNQADRRTRQTTDNMNKAFAGFKDQVADALGGTQLGSLVDSFNCRLKTRAKCASSTQQLAFMGRQANFCA